MKKFFFTLACVLSSATLLGRVSADRFTKPVAAFIRNQRQLFRDFLQKSKAHQAKAEALLNHIEKTKKEIGEIKRELTPEEIGMLRTIEALEKAYYTKVRNSFRHKNQELEELFSESDEALQEAEAATDELEVLNAQYQALLKQMRRKKSQRG